MLHSVRLSVCVCVCECASCKVVCSTCTKLGQRKNKWKMQRHEMRFCLQFLLQPKKKQKKIPKWTAQQWRRTSILRSSLQSIFETRSACTERKNSESFLVLFEFTFKVRKKLVSGKVVEDELKGRSLQR